MPCTQTQLHCSADRNHAVCSPHANPLRGVVHVTMEQGEEPPPWGVLVEDTTKLRGREGEDGTERKEEAEGAC